MVVEPSYLRGDTRRKERLTCIARDKASQVILMKKCPKVSDYINVWSGIDPDLEVMKNSESWVKPATMPNPKVIEVVEYEDYYSTSGAPFRKILPKESWDEGIQRDDPVGVAWTKRVKLIREFKIVKI